MLEVNNLQTRLYANIDKMTIFACFIAESRVVKFGPTLNYPVKNGARMAEETGGNNMFLLFSVFLNTEVALVGILTHTGDNNSRNYCWFLMIFHR